MNKRQRKKLLKERIVAVACGQWKPIIMGEETHEDGSSSIKGILIPKRRKDFDSWCKHIKYEDLKTMEQIREERDNESSN